MKIKKNGKVIRLTESDLKKIVKRVLIEQDETPSYKQGDVIAFIASDYGDVEGMDAAQKIQILSSIAFNSKIPEEIYTEGITEIKKQDMDYAKEMGYTIKLLAIAKKHEGELT